MPRSTRGPTGENVGAAGGAGGGVGPPKVYPEEKSESATGERKLSIGNRLYTECPRRNGQNFGRVFLMLNYNDILKTPICKVERLRR